MVVYIYVYLDLCMVCSYYVLSLFHVFRTGSYCLFVDRFTSCMCIPVELVPVTRVLLECYWSLSCDHAPEFGEMTYCDNININNNSDVIQL